MWYFHKLFNPIQTNGPNDSSDQSYDVRGLTFLRLPTHNYLYFIPIHSLTHNKIGRKSNNCVFILSFLYNLSSNMYRRITNQNKGWKEAAEVVGGSGECM